jgi:acyl phosphate:glycerol-3-phosphate acyltransferase
MIIIAVLLILLSYWYGCFSTARVLAKSVRSLNIYKVGTGFADTENIYFHVSKPLGLLTGILDIVKSYAYLFFLKELLMLMDRMALPPDLGVLYSTNLMLLYGLAILVGHCLPLTQHLRGGRGILTYFGIIAYFSFYPSLVTGIAALVIVFWFKQVRFAQYTMVILPVLLTLLFSALPALYILNPHHTGSLYTTKLLGMALAAGMLNIIVSKKLGEF